MKVLLLGATGMVGQGALRECLLAGDVSEVLTLGRTPSGQHHPKLHELIHVNLFDLAAIEVELGDFDACFFCIGVSSAGMAEADYTRLTFDLTLAVANLLARLNPRMAFVYVSGAGADSKETSTTHWKRVRGRLENALQRLPFKAVFIFRPNIIQPLHGIRSKTAAYRWFYTLTRPLLPVLRAWMPGRILSTEIVARAMLAVVREGAPKAVLETADINALGISGENGA